MASLRTLENRLVLACARTAPDVQHIEALMAQGPDWLRVLRKAERWGLAALVYSSLRPAVQSDRVPHAVAARFRDLYRREVVHSAGRRGLLRATLRKLSEAGVPVIVLKGAALAAVVYPSPTLRPMRNIELLVHEADQSRVDEMVRGMCEAPDANPYLSQEGVSVLDVGHHIVGAGSATDGLSAAARIPIADLWKRAQPVQIESVTTRVLSHEDLLLHLALHLAYTGGFVGQVITLCDIGEMCRRFRDTIDWSDLLTRAEAYDVAKPLYHALALAREVVGAEVPARALTRARASFARRPLGDRLLAATAIRAILSEDPAGPISRVARLGLRLLGTRRASKEVTAAFGRAARAWQRGRRAIRFKPRPARSSAHDTHGPLPATAILLPIYRPRLDGDVLEAVDRALAVLRHGDWYFMAPRSLDTSFYEERYGTPIVRFPDACLASSRAYSNLLLTDEFYAAFARYEFMLVVHDDVYVVRDDLPRWLAYGVDYIGAPWPHGPVYQLSMSPRPGIHGEALRTYVGNGGFSLRRIAACRRLLAEFREEAVWFTENRWNEDAFFGLFGQLSQEFVLPNLRVAAAFAWEVGLPRMHAMCQGQLPMAIHGYRKYDPEFFTEIILPASSANWPSLPTGEGTRPRPFPPGPPHSLAGDRSAVYGRLRRLSKATFRPIRRP